MASWHSHAAALVPALSRGLRKGDAGRVLIVGGSAAYTGAPFYAAMSALRTGADLVTVVTTPSASPIIKTYSPELIVLPILPESSSGEASSLSSAAFLDLVRPHYERSDAVIIGPGLGRDPVTMEACARLIMILRWIRGGASSSGGGAASAPKLRPIVLDADALWLLSLAPSLLALPSGASRAAASALHHPVVVTPNHVEMQRLVASCATSLSSSPPAASSAAAETIARCVQSFWLEQSVRVDASSAALHPTVTPGDGAVEAAAPGKGVALPSASSSESDVGVSSSAAGAAAMLLSERLGPGVVVLQKGECDIVALGPKVAVVAGGGSPRRCGGQGDILAGCVGVMSAWGAAATTPPTAMIDDLVQERLVAAAFGASLIVRAAAETAFASHRRATTTPEIISCIGPAFERTFPEK